MIASGTVDALSTAVSYPFDTISRRMMFTNESLLSSFLSIYKEQGFLGYFDGLTADILQGILSTLITSLFSTIKDKYVKWRSKERIIRKRKMVRRVSNFNLLCDICLREKKTRVFVPCGHCCCDECLGRILKKGNCHVCRAVIHYDQSIQL